MITTCKCFYTIYIYTKYIISRMFIYWSHWAHCRWSRGILKLFLAVCVALSRLRRSSQNSIETDTDPKFCWNSYVIHFWCKWRNDLWQLADLMENEYRQFSRLLIKLGVNSCAHMLVSSIIRSNRCVVFFSAVESSS